MLGVLCLVVGVPMIGLGLLLALPYVPNAFSSELPSLGEVISGGIFIAGMGACILGRKLVREWV